MPTQKFVALVSGMLREMDVVQTSEGTNNAGDLVKLTPDGELDPSVLPKSVRDLWSQAYTTTLSMSSADNAVSGLTIIPRNLIINRIDINCRTVSNELDTPTSAVSIMMYKTTNGTRSLVYLKGITSADTKDEGLSIPLDADDIVDVAMGTANGLAGSISFSIRAANRA